MNEELFSNSKYMFYSHMKATGRTLFLMVQIYSNCCKAFYFYSHLITLKFPSKFLFIYTIYIQYILVSIKSVIQQSNLEYMKSLISFRVVLTSSILYHRAEQSCIWKTVPHAVKQCFMMECTKTSRFQY